MLDRSSQEAPPVVAGEGLVVDNIGKSYRGRPVVKGVSLRLARGEVAGLLGPNGAGKTTCFYMITGLIQADYGAIYLDGENITAQPMYQRARMGLGYLPQETSIFRGMTVGQNVMAVVELREHDPAKARATVTELLEELHIEHLRDAPAISLSGGERRRVALEGVERDGEQLLRVEGPQLLGQGLGVGGVDVHGFLLWLLWAGVHRCAAAVRLQAAVLASRRKFRVCKRSIDVARLKCRALRAA